MIRFVKLRELWRGLWSRPEENTPDDEPPLGADEDLFAEPVILEIRDVIDLHAIPPRDVKAVVEEYLRQAHAGGFQYVRIIHGKGIGVQRQTVRTVLARTPFVVTFYDAPPEAGGWGATIAELTRQPTAERQLDANTTQNNRNNRPPFAVEPGTGRNLGGRKLDDYGFNLTGPLWLPKPIFGPLGYDARNKTFFHYTYQGYKEKLPDPGTTSVPTLLERQGDFSQSGIGIFDPLTTRPDLANPGRFIRDQFQCNGRLNVICPNRFNSVERRFLTKGSLTPVGEPFCLQSRLQAKGLGGSTLPPERQ